MKKFDLFLTKAELQKIHKDKIQYRSDESLQFMFASRDKVKNDIQWAEDKLIKKLIKKFNQSEPYVNLNRMFYGKNEVKRFRDNLFIKYYIKSHLSDIENPDQNSHKQDKNRLTSQAIYRLRTFRDIGMEDWQLPIQMVTEPFFTLEYLNDQDLDFYVRLKKDSYDLIASYHGILTGTFSFLSIFNLSLNNSVIRERMDLYGHILTSIMLGATIANCKTINSPGQISKKNRVGLKLKRYLKSLSRKDVRNEWGGLRSGLVALDRMIKSNFEVPVYNNGEIIGYKILNNLFNQDLLNTPLDNGMSLQEWLIDENWSLIGKTFKPNYLIIVEDWNANWDTIYNKDGSVRNSGLSEAQKKMIRIKFFQDSLDPRNDVDGFRKLKDLNSSQRLYLTNRIRAYESLISVFRMGLPYEGFALGKTSDSKFEAKIQTIASFINNITQEISNTTLFAQTFDKAGYSRFKRLKNIYSSSTHSGILNLNEIFWFETAIEFFIASLFDGDCAAFNSFCVCSYDNFYGDSNRIHRNSLTYKPFSEFLNHLALDFDFQRARHFSINVNGISIDVTTRSIFEREIILKAVELGVLESIIPPNIFDKLHSNYLLKDGSDIRLYFEHSDGINHYLLLDIGWKFVNDGGKILVFECLGYPENTQPFGQSPPEIYGPNKDLGCLSLVNGPDSIFPDSNWKGYCPVYILYPRSVVEKYYFSIKVQYIGIIAPLITQAQYYQLVDVIRAHPENKFEYSIVHLSSGKFNRNISTLEAKNIQTSFGLNLQRQLDGNYVCIGISPKMQKWWDNFHASLDNDSKMRQQIDHLISLAFRFKT